MGTPSFLPSGTTCCKWTLPYSSLQGPSTVSGHSLIPPVGGHLLLVDTPSFLSSAVICCKWTLPHSSPQKPYAVSGHFLIPPLRAICCKWTLPHNFDKTQLNLAASTNIMSVVTHSFIASWTICFKWTIHHSSLQGPPAVSGHSFIPTFRDYLL